MYYFLIHETLNTVVWFQVFLSNANNFQTDQFNPWTDSRKVLQLRGRVGLRVMVIKRYSIISRAPELGSHHRIDFNVITREPSFWVWDMVESYSDTISRNYMFSSN